MTNRPVPRRPWIIRGELIVLALGIGLRLMRLLDRRPLWLDEALLASNVLDPGMSLFQPLSHRQMAPIGYLVGESLVSQISTGEHALRLLPFLAAVAALLLFALLARRVLDPLPALFSTAVVACSPLLIYYSAEAKPYMLDVLAAVAMALATLRVARSDGGFAAWRDWGLVALGAAFISIPAPFLIAAGALALLADRQFRTARSVLRIGVAALPAVLVVGLHFLTVYRSTDTTSFMERYWAEFFLQPEPSALWRGAVKRGYEFFSDGLFGVMIYQLPQGTILLMVVLVLLGAAALARRSLRVAMLLVGPALFAMAAALAQRWPLAARLLLFLLPSLALLLGRGVDAVGAVLPARTRNPARALLGSVIVVPVLMGGFRQVRAAENRFLPLREGLRRVAEAHGRDATIYYSADIIPACRYYLTWHPAHQELDGDPTKRQCALRGTLSVPGGWPMYADLVPGMATRGEETLDQAWLRSEVDRLLLSAGEELWLVLGLEVLHPALQHELERRGAVLRTEFMVDDLRVQSYRVAILKGTGGR